MNSPTYGLTARHGMDTGPVAVDPCVSESYFERERRELFAPMWVNLLRREDEIPHAGDYFVRDIEVLGKSVIVVRGDDGRVRAFHNTCTHRGNRLVRAERGRARGFQCDFHGWTYDCNGRIAHVTDEAQFFDLDKSRLGLSEVHLQTWRGFLFVNFAREPAQTLEQSLGTFTEDLAPFPFDDMLCVGRYRYDVKANWKVTMNAFQEGYHVAFVHKRSAPDAFTGGDNPYCHIEYMKLQDNGNQSIAVPGNPSHTPSPTEALAYRFGATFTQGVGGRGAFPGTNQDKTPNWGFDLNILFPFSRINVGAGWYYLDAFWPLAQDHTVYELAFYFPRPTTAAEMISQEFSKIVLRDLSREDLYTNEVTHDSLMSGALSHFLLSDQEAAVRHLYATIEARLGAGSHG